MLSYTCLLFLALIALSVAKEQTIRVRGQVICNKRTVINVQVELREHDTLDPDDSLDKTRTDRDGYFRLNGKENEFTSISPYIRVTHVCDVGDNSRSRHGQNIKNCHRISDYKIPEKAINNGVFDMQFINLNIKGHNDKKVCD